MEHEDMHRKKTGEPASLAEDATDWASRRADARRNHERIIAAALEVFAERGLDATMTEVAARAKVGKATIYRSYPTKDDLIAAAVRREFEWLEQRILVATQDPNAYAALSALLPDVFERLMRQPSVGRHVTTESRAHEARYRAVRSTPQRGAGPGWDPRRRDGDRHTRPGRRLRSSARNPRRRSS